VYFCLYICLAHLSNNSIFIKRLRVEIDPLLKEGWILNNGDTPSLSIPERPPALKKHLKRGDYDELDFLQLGFDTKIKINGKATSFFQILKAITNNNLKRFNEGRKSKNHNKKYNPVSDKTLWRFIAMKLMNNLGEHGKTKHLELGLYDEVMAYLGVNRYKVLNHQYLMDTQYLPINFVYY
jgi:hypothetical protein